MGALVGRLTRVGPRNHVLNIPSEGAFWRLSDPLKSRGITLRRLRQQDGTVTAGGKAAAWSVSHYIFTLHYITLHYIFPNVKNPPRAMWLSRVSSNFESQKNFTH